MLKQILKAYDSLVVGLAVLSGLTVVLMLLIIFADVTVRTFGIPAPSFGVTIVEYALIYFTIMAAPYLVRIKGHVTIDVVVKLFPVKFALYLKWAVTLVSAFACIVFAVISLQLTIDAYVSDRYDVRGIDVPLWLSFLPLPLGFVLVALEFLRTLITDNDAEGAKPEAAEGF